MLNQVQILPSGYSKRAASATPLGGKLKNWPGSTCENASKNIDACSQLQRLILEYGKHFPHPIMSRACDEPKAPCLHFCYCSSTRPCSSATVPTVDSGESDGEGVDEMKLTFPRKGDMIDYLSELKLNTRHSTPLHWLEPEDKLAIHEITAKLKKAFKESKTSGPRPFSAAPNVENNTQKTKNDNDKIKTETENDLTVRIPKRLIKSSSVRPTPRLTVVPCPKCVRRQESAARRAAIQRFESPVMMNVVEACIGPSPTELDKTMFFLNAHASKAVDFAPPPSPSAFSDEKSSQVHSSKAGQLAYTGFIQSGFSEKVRLLKEAAAEKRAEREKERLERQQLQLQQHQHHQSRVSSAAAVEIKMPDSRSALNIEDIFDDMQEDADLLSLDGASFTEAPPSPSPTKVPALQPCQLSDSEGEQMAKSSHRNSRPKTKSPRTVIIVDPRPQSQKNKQQPEPNESQQKWMDRSFKMKSPSRSPELERKLSTVGAAKTEEPSLEGQHQPTMLSTPKTIVPILKKTTTSTSTQKPTSSPSSSSSKTNKPRSTSAVLRMAKRLPSSSSSSSAAATKMRPSTAANHKNRTSSNASDIHAKLASVSEQPATKVEEIDAPPPVPVEAFTNKQLRERVASFSKMISQAAEDGSTAGDTMDDVPDSGDVAKLKAQLTNAAEPLNIVKTSGNLLSLRDSEISSSSLNLNSGRLSPPLVHPAALETTAFKTLEEIEAMNNQILLENNNEIVKLANRAGSARKLLKSGDGAAKSLRPPPLPSRPPSKKLAPSTVDKVKAQSPPIVVDDVIIKPSSPSSTPLFVKSSERRPKKELKDEDEVLRATRRAARRRRSLIPGQLNQQNEIGQNDDENYDNNDDYDDGDELDFFFEEDDEEEEITVEDRKKEAVVVDETQLSSQSSDSDDEPLMGEVGVAICEENEKWWPLTQKAAKLALEIEQLCGRFLSRLPKPPSPPRSPGGGSPSRRIFRRRRTAPPRIRQPTAAVVSDPKQEFVEQLGENSREQLARDEAERREFLDRLREIRTNIRQERKNMRRNQRETTKRIRFISAELESVMKNEENLSTKYYTKRDRERAERDIERQIKAQKLKAEASAQFSEPTEDEERADLLRDEALLMFDDELREAEIHRLDNLLTEYEEQKRLDLERRWHEIDMELEEEESSSRKMDLVEEDLLLGDVRAQTEQLRREIDSEQAILKANQLDCDNKVSALQARDDELVAKRVEAERLVVAELTQKRDQLASIFKEEEDAERAVKEAEDEDTLHRTQSALLLREQRRLLTNEISLSPSYIFSYFRLLERPVDDDGPQGKKRFGTAMFRRPNTPFKSK